MTTRVRAAEPGTGGKTRLRKGMAHGSLSFRVEPSEPQGGVGRFELGGDVCFRCVGLRSQSLAYPTLRYRALSGRRAVYQWGAAVRMSAPPLWEMRALFADCFRNSAAEPVAGGKTRLRESVALLGWHAQRLCDGRGVVRVGDASSSCRTSGWREDPADEAGEYVLLRVNYATISCSRDKPIQPLPTKPPSILTSGQTRKSRVQQTNSPLDESPREAIPLLGLRHI